MSAKTHSSRKLRPGNYRPELRFKASETIPVQKLWPHSTFDVGIVELAQDLAYHHVKRIGLSATGIIRYSMNTPCWVLPPKSARKRIVVVGGLESLFMARTVSLQSDVYCDVLQRPPPPERLVSWERERLLTVAPQYCQGGHEGAALLKRVWQSCTPAERKDIYGVSSFQAFASRAGIKLARQAKAPFAKTRAHYAPGDQMQFPGF